MPRVIGACSKGAREAYAASRTKAIVTQAIAAPNTPYVNTLARSTRDRRGVVRKVDVIVMCRNSPVIAMIPRRRTNVAAVPVWARSVVT